MRYNLVLIATALLLSTMLIASSCKKDKTPATEEQLPPETQTGAFTIGFKVDGKIYTAKGKGGLLANESVNHLFYSDTAIRISASNINSKFNFSVTIKYSGFLGNHYTKEYPYLGLFTDNSNGTIPGNSNSYSTDSTLRASVNIKYFNGSISPLNEGTIISGTFEMDAKNANGKIIKITEGRFDIGY